MSYKSKDFRSVEPAPCEKFINKMLKNERGFVIKPQTSSTYEEKPVCVIKASPPLNNQRLKQKPNNNNIRQVNPIPKPTPPILITTLNNPKLRDSDIVEGREFCKRKMNYRNRSRGRSSSSERESWGHILHKNYNGGKPKPSTFKDFDPLRTIHFLSNELNTKIQSVLPDDNALIQIIGDIQHALKRIPKEVNAFLINETERIHMKPCCVTKGSQTPPTLYQDDTEKFQKIMEENTYRLEASCKQLEIVCTNLQREKEMTERELEEAKDEVELLCAKVKNLEFEMEEIANIKIKQLEEEKKNLKQELNKAKQELNDNHKLIEELQKQKATSEENYARLDCEMSLVKMENEKFITMLSVREREIKVIQDEMIQIQEQVNNHLQKLNIEMLPRVTSLKSLSDPSCNIKANKEAFEEIGDTPISSINTNNSEEVSPVKLKEFPCGDGEISTTPQEAQEKYLDNFIERLTKLKTENLKTLMDNKDSKSLDELLRQLNPSYKT